MKERGASNTANLDVVGNYRVIQALDEHDLHRLAPVVVEEEVVETDENKGLKVGVGVLVAFVIALVAAMLCVCSQMDDVKSINEKEKKLVGESFRASKYKVEENGPQ